MDSYTYYNLTDASRVYKVESLLRKFANHKITCHCFICRAMTPDEHAALTEFWERMTGDGHARR